MPELCKDEKRLPDLPAGLGIWLVLFVCCLNSCTNRDMVKTEIRIIVAAFFEKEWKLLFQPTKLTISSNSSLHLSDLLDNY